MKTAQGIRFVETRDVRRWLREHGTLADYTKRVGQTRLDGDYLERALGLPLHLRFVVERLSMEADEHSSELGADVTVDQDGALASIPFYSLCRGLFLPLSGMQPDKTAYIFGLETPPPPMAAEREQLLATFLEKKVGLTLVQKLACILGDPFLGRPSTFRRDSLMRLLLSMQLRSRRTMLDRLTVVGEIAVLFAERVKTLRPPQAPLTAAEVLETLRLMPKEKRLFKFDILRSLFERCGKLEAYFLARLILRKAGFGFDYQGPLIARKLGQRFGAPEEQVAHAMALTDAFHVARILADEGADGLRKVQLQPLVPVRPALATGSTADVKTYPVWVERKYDGIRLMLHKSTDSRGSILCGAYTRTRGDWLEQVPGLDFTVKSLPCRNCIVDGELYGTVLDIEGGARPASVYDVFAMLQGERPGGVNLKYAAFDIIYLNGEDLTQKPLSERRNVLQTLLAPVSQMPLPVPLQLSEGQLAKDKDDVSRLYQHFRNQGYEGVIAKDLAGSYMLSSRDPTWLKRKPTITLDLVVLAAVFAVTTKEKAGLFGSYVIGARTKENTFADVGDVAGVDRIRDAEIQTEIMREGLITGRRIERQSASGTRPGLELRPHIVITVRFEGITRDFQTQELSLRDPKLVVIRSDKVPLEASTVDDIEEIFLRQRVG